MRVVRHPDTGAIIEINASFQNPSIDDVHDGDVIDAGNFSQHTPDTPIMVGRTLTINGGNWTNVRRDTNWTITGGNWTQVSRCTHLHPNLIDHGLTVCDENCDHVSHTDTIEGENSETITIYHYAEEPTA